MNKSKLPFVLLNPIISQPDLSKIHPLLAGEDLVEFLDEVEPGDLIALDIETRGTEAHNTECQVVGFGLADSRGAGYWTAEHWPFFLEQAHAKQLPLIGHNIFFDGAFAYRDAGYRHLNWKYCTYGLYKQLATEGWPGQQWGLKKAQVELLGWKQANEVELNKWLVENKFLTTTRKSIEDVANAEDWLYQKDIDMWAKADKSQMWQAPAHILGKYCALDAYATHELFFKILKPILDDFHVLKDYHEGPFINLVEILIEQQHSGFAVNVEGLITHQANLQNQLEEVNQTFFSLPEIQDAVALYNKQIIQEHLDKEPPRHLVTKEFQEPKKKYRKDGSLSGLWLKWDERRRNPQTPTQSKRWEQWYAKLQTLENENHFNVNSNKQLEWLFYEQLGYPVLLTTVSGSPATDNKAMGQWGAAGKLLIKKSTLLKEEGYVGAAIATQLNGVIHPQFKVPGTLTGRLSGSGNFNVQQQPKTREYLSLLHARPGHVWVDFDYVALEPSVLTELSRDPNMLRIYGPGVPKNDIYIFVGAHIPGIKEVFIKCGYDPYNPSKESIASIKKEHKTLRGICKTLVLSAQYGAGAKKIHETLKLQGVNKSLEEVQEIYRAYWNLYTGIKEYERFLLKCWQKNNGWILNGIGRPLTIHADLTKDIVNRIGQSTGHDIHMIGLQIFRQLLIDSGLSYRWIIADFHDEAILEVPCGTEQEIIKLMYQMEKELNELLQPYVPIKIDPAIGTCLADFKVEG